MMRNSGFIDSEQSMKLDDEQTGQQNRAASENIFHNLLSTGLIEAAFQF